MNKNYFKAGILIAVLGVPALVFLFLKIFGENKFDLPYYFPEIDANGQTMVIKGDTVWSKAPSFTLKDQNNALITNNDSSIYVVNFFFSRCTTICPPTLSNLERLQEAFKGRKQLKIYSISIDPKYDSVGLLKSVSGDYNAKYDTWKFLTGDKKYIYDIAVKGFKLPVADASDYDEKIKSPDETFIHSDKLLLIDSKGFFRGIYSSTDKFEIDRLKAEIKVLLSNE